MAILRTRTPAIQVQTLPLEGPRILRVAENISFRMVFGVGGFDPDGILLLIKDSVFSDFFRIIGKNKG